MGIKYPDGKDVLRAIFQCRSLGFREIAFDWSEIGVKGFSKKRSLIMACKTLGKVKKHRRGFSIQFFDV
jgi:hypothetical protein